MESGFRDLDGKVTSHRVQDAKLRAAHVRELSVYTGMHSGANFLYDS